MVRRNGISLTSGHKKTRPYRAGLRACWSALAVRAGFELMFYIIDIQYFKNILCQG
jgi:hypothetical protein